MRTVPLIVFALVAAAPFAAAGEAEEACVRSLLELAVPLRSIDPDDEDFADLAPLAAVLSGVRVVQLGEQSHGDGAAFFAKARLIRYLHRELGFTVLAFESGLWDSGGWTRRSPRTRPSTKRSGRGSSRSGGRAPT